ncbi:MAG: carboxylating nicotinate-nucleotide diphosphorylase [Vulcanibacillus sp.]
MNNIKLRMLLQQFFNEDIGDRDITSESIFSPEDKSSGQFLMKENGVIAGLTIIKDGYSLFDPNIEVIFYAKDGDVLKAGDVIATVTGSITSLLSGERVILNLLQRLSAIATTTKKAIDLLANPEIKVCDTRKTTPGLRMLEKYAVRCGGGYNHRFGLYDAVLIKDNHIAFSGSITQAINNVKSQVGQMVKIEVEVESKEEVLEAVACKADVILFDNCTPNQIKEFTKDVPNYIITEASGGITLDNISDYRYTGVNYLSMGVLTHSIRSLDISFNLVGGKKYESS